MNHNRYGNDSYNYHPSSGSPWSLSGGRQALSRFGGNNRGNLNPWSQNSFMGHIGGNADSPGVSGGTLSNPEMQMLMDQVKQLQQRVFELSKNQSAFSEDRFSDQDQSRTGSNIGQLSATSRQKVPLPANGQRRILLVTNLPPTLASCDSVYFMFERFGIVERVKILRNQRSSALVQMASPQEAEKAVAGQEVLKKTAPEIFVNFSTNVNLVRLPSEKGLINDGLTRDYTGAEPYNATNIQSATALFGGTGNSLLGAPPQILAPVRNDALLEVAATAGLPSAANGPCLLVSSLPDELANPDSLCNIFGFYGDVLRVKILRNKRDCALVQMSKPHQATLCRNFLDQARVYGKKICVSFSRMSSIKLPSDIGIEDDSSTKDYSNVRGVHRFRNPTVAQKLMKNLCAPTPLLHVANLSEEIDKDAVKTYLVENGFSVKEVFDCGKDGSMALVQLASVEEAIAALAKLHNKPHPTLKSKNNGGLCFSFSNRRMNE